MVGDQVRIYSFTLSWYHPCLSSLLFVLSFIRVPATLTTPHTTTVLNTTTPPQKTPNVVFLDGSLYKEDSVSCNLHEQKIQLKRREEKDVDGGGDQERETVEQGCASVEDSFIAFYGGSDTSTGSLRIQVETHSHA